VTPSELLRQKFVGADAPSPREIWDLLWRDDWFRLEFKLFTKTLIQHWWRSRPDFNEVIDDLWQETAIEFGKHFRQNPRLGFKAEKVDRFTGFIVTILQRIMIDAWPRVKKLYSTRHLELDEQLDLVSVPRESDGDAQQLRQLINELPEPARTALHLKLNEGLSLRDVATRLRIDYRKLYYRVQLATKYLRDRITRSYPHLVPCPRVPTRLHSVPLTMICTD
jgi:RNA polymerase sigma factor (sigma-70 family)